MRYSNKRQITVIAEIHPKTKKCHDMESLHDLTILTSNKYSKVFNTGFFENRILRECCRSDMQIAPKFGKMLPRFLPTRIQKRIINIAAKTNAQKKHFFTM